MVPSLVLAFVVQARDGPATRGLAQLHLGHVLTAVALNMLQLNEWSPENWRAKTRLTPFGCLLAWLEVPTGRMRRAV